MQVSLNPLQRKPSQLEADQKQKFQNEPVLIYLKSKCGLPQSQIQSRLRKGQSFEIKGQGHELDTQLMENVLLYYNFYEEPAQKLLKDEAMAFVKSIVEDWSLNIARNQKKINKDQLPNYMAKVLAFGSHVLDLRSNSSDIDLVCVVPNFVNRQTHFLQGLASKFDQQSEVKGLSVIKFAKVPIITFDYKQINIDISFCKLQDQTIPRDIERVINMDLINKIKDQKSHTSIMGRKNNLMILELAGPTQQQNFKQTLRIIKVWSKNRGISSNGMGFLGGISWAIMLAKICQIFPYHKPSRLLAQFFIIYRLWRWKQMPVALIQPTKQALQVAQSQKSLMTVFTPGNHFNSTKRVNRINFQIIQKQILTACQILEVNRAGFDTLCQKIDFFGIPSFNFYIQIDVCGVNKKKQHQKQYKDFLGHVQSKILNLLNLIIKYNQKDLGRLVDANSSITKQVPNEQKINLKIRPNPKSYKKNDPIYELCNAFFLGIELRNPVDLARAVTEWCQSLDRQRSGKEQTLNARVFQCQREDFLQDVEVYEVVKKVQKEDPRLAARRARKN